MTWGRRILLHVDPFPAPESEARRTEPVHNRAAAASHLRRWAMIAMVLFLCMRAAGELVEGDALFFLPEAIAAFGCCIAVAVCAVIGAVYLLLGAHQP